MGRPPACQTSSPSLGSWNPPWQRGGGNVELPNGPDLLSFDTDLGSFGFRGPTGQQEIDIDGQEWRLEFRSLLPVERWNAQISLLCGMGAASLMVYARVGLLRTLPPPDPRDVKRLHRTARGLHIDWPAEVIYPDFIRSLDPRKPTHAAMVVALSLIHI